MTNEVDALGATDQEPDAIVARPIFAGPPERTYLCDAGCRPNPGTHLPVVWDGENFLETAPVEGTNHRASYHAVQAALKDADERRAERIELRVTSVLVFRQLTTGGYCRNGDLEQLRDLTLTLADRVSPIRMVLVKEPFILGGLVFETRDRLRDHVHAVMNKTV